METDPAALDAARDAALAFYKAGDYTTSIATFTTAISLLPSPPPPSSASLFSNRAAALVMLKRYEDASEDCARALALEPGNEDTKAGMRSVGEKIAEGQGGGASKDPKERDAQAKRAMQDPECVSSPFYFMRPSFFFHPTPLLSHRHRRPSTYRIQQIMRDPVVNQVLQDMQEDTSGKTFNKVMRDAVMGPKIEKLIAAGIISVG